jgi:uncharacterized membrane protein
MFIGDAHTGSVFLAAFLASLVEFVEALTIVLAVATVRGWRSACLGAGSGAVLLILLIILLGPALGLIPIHALQLTVGILLLLFGIRWLRKAVLRAAGILALHDEERAYEKETAALRQAGLSRGHGFDAVAVATSFKAVVLEGLEVVFIVIAVGATGGMIVPAGIGAGAALALVMALGFVIHKPLTKVPENGLKLMVGVMVSAFGVFWIGEGLGDPWPGEDWAILALCLGFLLSALAAIGLLRMAGAKRMVGP